MTTRGLLADDQDDIRGGFRLVLGSRPDMTVVGEAADGVAAVEAVEWLRPDVVLVDIRMPRLDGRDVTRWPAGPEVAVFRRVIVVNAFEVDEYVHTGLRYGPVGFCSSGAGRHCRSRRFGRRGRARVHVVQPQATVRPLDPLSAHPAPAVGRFVVPDQPAADPLTTCEHEIVRLIARGHTNAEIGAELYITAGAGKTHIANIQAKSAVRNRVGIAAWAWANGHVVPGS